MPPPSVLFAQKASAVSKCAGMDPREMDLEKFRSLAPLIFVRAYNAIYKERLLSVNPYTGEEDPKVGAQAVIEKLYEKTQVSALQTITGADVVEGGHKAIGVLVGVLFAEGQRMWLAKQEEKKRVVIDDDQKSVPVYSAGAAILDEEEEEKVSVPAASMPKKVVRKGKKKQKRKVPATATAPALGEPKQVPEYNDDQFEEEEPESDERLKIVTQNYEESFSGIDENNPSPKDVKVLMDRIAELEHQLKSKSTNPSVNVSMGKIRRVRTKDRAPMSPSDRPGTAPAPGVSQDPPIALASAAPQPWLPRAVRPSSAPSIRRKVLAPHVQNSAIGGEGESAFPSKPSTPPMPAIPRFPASWYTYDMSSGRRVLMSEAEREAVEARKKKEALGNIKSAADMISEGGGAENSHPKPPRALSPREEVVVPVAPKWPGPSTESSVEAWKKKQQAAREPKGKLGKLLTEQSETVQAAIAAFKEPKHFPAYKLLENEDLVISIEHCHSCSLHNVTLRHKTGEYVKRADSFLRAMAHITHENNVAARVGVARFNTHLIASKRLSDADNRIGAFEIQVAYRNSQGELKVALLHSKLSTTQWPSRRGIELKLKTFLTSQRVPTFYKRPDAPDSYSETRYGGLGMYPVGMGSFSETPVGDPLWCYAMASAAAATAPPQSPTTTIKSHKSQAAAAAAEEEEEHGLGDGLHSMQWVFDSRGVTVPPLFDVGTTVFVTQAPKGNANSPAERHPLLGVVKSVPVDPSGNIRVKLKYHQNEATVKETQLLSLSDHVPDDDLAGNLEVPVSLCVLLLLAGLQQTGKSLPALPDVSGNKSPIVFRVNDSGDYKDPNSGVVHLCRSSLFHQLRSLAAAVEAKYGSSDDDHLLSHPAVGELADVQLAYGENTLNWVASRFGQVVDTMALQRCAVEWAKNLQQAASEAKAQAEHVGVVETEAKVQKVQTPRVQAEEEAVAASTMAAAVVVQEPQIVVEALGPVLDTTTMAPSPSANVSGGGGDDDEHGDGDGDGEEYAAGEHEFEDEEDEEG